MLFAGFAVSNGDMTLFAAVAAGVLGNLRRLLDRLGGRLLRPRGAAREEPAHPHQPQAPRRPPTAGSREHGDATVFWTRMLPIVRTFISLPAGVAEMPFWRFTDLHARSAASPGSSALTLIGRSAGDNWDDWKDKLHYVDYAVAALIVLGGGLLPAQVLAPPPARRDRTTRLRRPGPGSIGRAEPNRAGSRARRRSRGRSGTDGAPAGLQLRPSAHRSLGPRLGPRRHQRRGPQGLRGRRPRRRGAGAADRPAAPDRRGAAAPRRPPRRRHRPLLPARGRHRPDARGMDRPPARRSPRHRLRPRRRLGRDGRSPTARRGSATRSRRRPSTASRSASPRPRRWPRASPATAPPSPPPAPAGSAAPRPTSSPAPSPCR